MFCPIRFYAVKEVWPISGNSDTHDARREMMLREPMRKLIPKMAVPTVIGMLASAFYSLADAFYVSKLGTAAAGAVGVGTVLDSIVMTAGAFLAIGSNSYIARLLGARQEKKASQVLSSAFFSALFCGGAVAAAGLFWLPSLIRLLGGHGEVENYAFQYARFVLFASPVTIANLVLSQCLRSEGSAKRSMAGMAAGAILNAGLEPLFIFVFEWGIRGASIAMAVSRTFSLLILLSPYLRRRSMLRLHPKNISFCKDIRAEVFKMGSPSLLRNGLATIAGILLNNLAGSYSESALAAVSVSNRIMLFLSYAVLGFGQGFQPVAGYNWGAKRYDRVRRAYRFSAITGFAAALILSLSVALLSRQLLSLFTKTDADMLRLGVLSVVLQCAAIPIQAWVVIVNMLYAGTGKAFGAIVLGSVRHGICFFPMFWLLPRIFGAEGVTAIQAASDGLSLLVAIPFAISVDRQLKRLEREQKSS